MGVNVNMISNHSRRLQKLQSQTRAKDCDERSMAQVVLTLDDAAAWQDGMRLHWSTIVSTMASSGGAPSGTLEEERPWGLRPQCPDGATLATDPAF